MENTTEDYQDKKIQCVSCGCWFLWEVGEQIYFKDLGLYPPRRCEECRKARRQRIIPDYAQRPK